VQIAAADAAGDDANHRLAVARHEIGHLAEGDLAGSFAERRPHGRQTKALTDSGRSSATRTMAIPVCVL